METLSDLELAEKWKGGVVEAYNEIVRRYMDLIHRYVRVRCGNGSEISDICQEVFLEVCLKISNYQEEYAFSAWLYSIARKKIVDRHRRQKAFDEYQVQVHGGEDHRTPSQVLEERESATELWGKAFEVLSENQAMALWLRVQGQMSVSQVAQTMGMSESNVKVLLFRARQVMAREIQQEGDMNHEA